MKILVTGATGYVGGRLIPRLLQAGHHVVAISRSVTKLQSREWASHPEVTLASDDMLDPQALPEIAKDCDIAYYLVHSMVPNQPDFAKADRQAARNFNEAIAGSQIKQVIYLGGLGEGKDLSLHLRSRDEVGSLLQEGPVPVTILRAAMIIGSGSASFEILRYLVDRLPVMVTPKWVNTPTQPIAIRNVLVYLIGVLNHPEAIGKTFDIGGPDVLNYKQLMYMYAEEAGLGIKLIIPVPVFTPKLSSYWIHFVTPVHASLARPLAEGLKNRTVCENNDILTLIPQPLLSCREAIRLALARTKQNQVTSHWTDAGEVRPPEYVYPDDPDWSGGTVYRDVRTITLRGTPERLWRPIIRIGGENGWYYGNTLWKIRGLMDLFLGGIGLRGGRRHPEELRPGDALDFWRVIEANPPHRLRLSAEMKLPGEAYLTFDLREIDEKTVTLKQSAIFVPTGLLGVAYWWAVTPLHHLVFNGMLEGIAEESHCTILSGPKQVPKPQYTVDHPVTQ